MICKAKYYLALAAQEFRDTEAEHLATLVDELQREADKEAKLRGRRIMALAQQFPLLTSFPTLAASEPIPPAPLMKPVVICEKGESC